MVLDVGCTLSLSGLFECPYNMVVAFPPEQVMPEREQDRDHMLFNDLTGGVVSFLLHPFIRQKVSPTHMQGEEN